MTVSINILQGTIFDKGIVRTSYSDDKSHSLFPFTLNRGMDTRNEECIMEIWKDVVGWEGLYQVSNEGRVKRLGGTARCKHDRIRKQSVAKTRGYLVCVLSDEDKKKCCFVHRLVAEAFVSNPNNYPCVNHKDEDKHNNHADNLEWCTIAYNDSYGTRNQRCKEAIRKSCAKKVGKFTENGELIETFDSLSDVQKTYGYDRNAIGNCCRGVTSTSYGFEWRFL